jgi:hypothetical protein
MDAPVKENRDAPPLYTGIALEVDEIVIAFNVLRAATKEIRGSFEAKQDIPLKLACDDAARAAGQIKTMAEHLASVLTRHINRKVRS